MKKIFCLIALAAAAPIPAVANAQDSAPAQARATVTTGRMLHTADGRRLAPVYRVQRDGSAQIILQGRLVTVPAATLTVDGGKAMTSLSRAALTSTR